MNFLKDMLLGRWLCRDAYEDSLGFGWALINLVIVVAISWAIWSAIWEVNFS